MTCNVQRFYSVQALYHRAIGCARIKGAEFMVLNHVMDGAWFKPRLMFGATKAYPVPIHAASFGEACQYDRVSIHHAIASLIDRNILQDLDSGYIPNPKWESWLAGNSVDPAIIESCKHYVRFSLDESQGVHEHDVTSPVSEVTQPVSEVTHTRAQQGRIVPRSKSQVMNYQELASPVSEATQAVSEANGTAVANMERAARINSSQSEPSDSEISERSEKPSGYIYIVEKPLDQQREATSADDSMQSTITVGHSGAKYENNDIYIYPDNASLTSIGPETNQASADPSPIITANPAPTIPADTATGSPTTPATASPTSRMVESSTEAHGDYSGAYSSTPGHPRSEPAPPAATVANNHASSHEAMPSRTASEYTMAGELPGPFTVDADQWRTFVALTDQYMPMREIASKLHLYRRQFPTAWFVKIAKRCVLTKDKRSITHGYMLSILRAWGRNGDGPDTGPEEEYRDDLSMIAVPFVPFQSTIMGNSEGVELDAYGEPSRFAPGVKAKLIEMMNERLRRHAL